MSEHTPEHDEPLEPDQPPPTPGEPRPEDEPMIETDEDEGGDGPEATPEQELHAMEGGGEEG